MELRAFQKQIEDIYYERDKRRGVAGTFMWFIEEVGELSTAIRGGDRAAMEEEFADCLAWLATLANINGIDLAKAIEKYTVKGVEGFK